MPHILRSVTLIGIDSVMAPQAKRERAWRLLSDHLDRNRLDAMTEVNSLTDLPRLALEIIGRISGRRVIRVT
ncbi:MAG: hypothetical protein KF849_13495 [Rhizobiaceae bacterium]|jgi:acrylyl-CoA reductase (NADPH)|nr:hypothetical protein [Rhizobiaceae bacterium]